MAEEQQVDNSKIENGSMENGKTGMSKALKLVIGLVILAGIIYGIFRIGALYGADQWNKAMTDLSDEGVQAPSVEPEFPTNPTIEEPTTPTTPVKETDQTVDWKTYENKDYEFSFKYPEDYKIEELSGTHIQNNASDPNESISSTDPSQPSNLQVNDAVNIVSDADIKIGIEYSNTLPINATRSEFVKFKLNQQLLESNNAMCLMTEPSTCFRYLKHDNIYFTISYTEYQSEKAKIQLQQIDQILSTFKFTE